MVVWGPSFHVSSFLLSFFSVGSFVPRASSPWALVPLLCVITGLVGYKKRPEKGNEGEAVISSRRVR